MKRTKEELKRMLSEMLESQGKEVFLDFIAKSLFNLEERVTKLEKSKYLLKK